MKSLSLTEASLDRELAAALRGDLVFARWFLDRTRFRSESFLRVECREDNPWSDVVTEVRDEATGALKVVKKGRETDVLAIYQTSDGRRLALHVENKLGNGLFTPHQAESYSARLSQWQMREKLGMYVEATSVLVAPKAFYDRNTDKAQLFESYISHEDISQHIAAFRQAGGAA